MSPFNWQIFLVVTSACLALLFNRLDPQICRLPLKRYENQVRRRRFNYIMC